MQQNITKNNLKEEEASMREIDTIIRKNRLNIDKSWQANLAKVLQKNEKDLDWRTIGKPLLILK